MKRAVGIVCAVGLCLSVPVTADSSVQFSARAVQSAADGKLRESLIYVGDNQIRMERQQGDSNMVQIYDMNAQHLLLLVPEQKMYSQSELPEGAIDNPMLPQTTHNLCSTLPEASCEQLGSESLYNRAVSKWEMTVERKGVTLHSLHWIDDQRFMSLRDVWPDGSVTELKLLGMEDRDGRETEHWQRSSTFADGTKESSMQWYDPELQIFIREELPSGLFRELTSIKVGPQSPALFQVPVDYQRVEISAPVQ